MKSEDFERLKKLCQENDFELLNVDHEDNEKYYVIAKKKDLWEGAEFGECLIRNQAPFTIGKIYKMNRGIDSEKAFINDKGVPDGFSEYNREHFKPSTESAYIEQLKKEAFERFGEIKKGDRFDTGYGIHSIIENHPEWFYNKHIDFLYYKGLIVYSKGKWATRVKERVEVKNWSYRTEEKGGKIYHECVFICPIKEFNDDVHIFLSSQLEKYLNGEIE